MFFCSETGNDQIFSWEFNQRNFNCLLIILFYLKYSFSDYNASSEMSFKVLWHTWQQTLLDISDKLFQT